MSVLSALSRWRMKPVTHHPPAGRARLDAPRHVVVVGGGLAGCAAAAVLAERGARVTVVEKEAFLGGRVGGWRETMADGTGMDLDRGFHAFFRQYYNLRAFMRRFDPGLTRLRPLEDYPLLGPDEQVETFSGLPTRPPLNLISLVFRTPTLKLRDLARIPPWPTLEMLGYDRERTFAEFDGMTAGAYLDALGFPDRARQMLFEVFAHSFFNPEYEMSAAEMIRLFHFYFCANPEGLIFDVLDGGFGEALWAPARRYLEALGVRFELEREVARVDRTGGDGFVVHTGAGEPLEADAVVLAVTVPPLQAIVGASPDLDDPALRDDVAGLRTTNAFTVWRMWLDRPVRSDRAAFAGTAGLGSIDNISVYERFHEPSRRWAERHGGSVVELHAYALPEGTSPAELRRELWETLVATYPELGGAIAVEERFRIDQDCPGFAPGAWASRPETATGVPGLVLAGDFVKLPIPSALMDGAVTSGFLAANTLLERWGVRGEVIRSVPERGLLAEIAPGIQRIAS